MNIIGLSYFGLCWTLASIHFPCTTLRNCCSPHSLIIHFLGQVHQGRGLAKWICQVTIIAEVDISICNYPTENILDYFFVIFKSPLRPWFFVPQIQDFKINIKITNIQFTVLLSFKNIFFKCRRYSSFSIYYELAKDDIRLNFFFLLFVWHLLKYYILIHIECIYIFDWRWNIL